MTPKDLEKRIDRLENTTARGVLGWPEILLRSSFSSREEMEREAERIERESGVMPILVIPTGPGPQDPGGEGR